jgi:hypothetical protein
MPKSSIFDKDIIYRAIRASGWTNENNEVSPTAFKLRESDEGKLSILLKANCEAKICSANLSGCYGEILLRTGKIEYLGLEVKPEPILPHIPDHAIILNLPLPEDFIEAERMATLLVEIVAAIQRKPEKYGKRQI